MEVNTKYKFGDKVWFMHGNKPSCGIIAKIIATEYAQGLVLETYIVKYKNTTLLKTEELKFCNLNIFLTKEELIRDLYDQTEE